MDAQLHRELLLARERRLQRDLRSRRAAAPALEEARSRRRGRKVVGRRAAGQRGYWVNPCGSPPPR